MRSLIILFLITSFAAQSQTDLHSYFATSGVYGTTQDDAEKKLNVLIHSLSSSGLSDEKLLRKTFHRLHTTLLKHYEAYAGFDKIFTSGQYDCLTATALFAHVLDELQFSYEVVETNYHIFLIVKTLQGDVLLETTDRFDGFVSDEAEIAARIEKYKLNNSPRSNGSGFVYHYSFNLYKTISPNKLIGLLYYNQAVKAYNQHSWLESAKSLEKANALYASSRCEALGTILIQTVLESALTDQKKNDCFARLRNFWAKKSDVVAAN